MATTRFNGATATLANGAGTTIASAVGITSFGLDSGGRAEIDITTSASTSREVVAGFSNPRRMTLGLLLDSPTLAQLDTMVNECASGTLAVSFGTDCNAPSQFLSLSVFLMSYNVEGTMDDVLQVSCEFLVDERTAAPDPE